MNSLWDMFLTFFITSITTFGGGYAMIPLMGQGLIRAGWLTSGDMSVLIALSTMMPGAFGSNAATFAGMKVFGPAGAAVCALGVVLPCAALSTIIAKYFYGFQRTKIVQGALSGVKPVVVGLIAATAFQFALKKFFQLDYKAIVDFNATWTFLQSVDWRAVVLFAGALFCLVKLKIDPVLVILGCGVLGLALYWLAPMVLG